MFFGIHPKRVENRHTLIKINGPMFDHTETPKKEYNHWARPDTIVPFDT